MTIKLSEQREKDLVSIQPYYSQKQQARKIDISINCLMKLRKYAGLSPKDKGRPKGTGIVFKGDKDIIPENIVEALDRIKIEIKVKKILTKFPEEVRPILANKIITSLKGNTEEKLKQVEEYKNEPYRIKKFIEE